MTRSGSSGVAIEAFIVDTGAITRAIRQQHIEALVRERFPPIGAPPPPPTASECIMIQRGGIRKAAHAHLGRTEVLS